MAVAKDGLIIGNQKEKGAHLTMLEKDGRFTIHKTEGQNRTNLLAQDSKMWGLHFALSVSEIMERSLKRKPPKYVYSIDEAKFYALKFEGKTVSVGFNKNYWIFEEKNKMSYEQFLACPYVMGVTKSRMLIKKGKFGCYKIGGRDMKELARKLRKDPFLNALRMGFKTNKKLDKASEP